jgi:cyanophycinase-like exopeptidase
MSFSLHHFGKCMPLNRRIEMGLLRVQKNLKHRNFNTKKLVVGGTSATALFIISMPNAHCAAAEDPLSKLVGQAKAAGNFSFFSKFF